MCFDPARDVLNLVFSKARVSHSIDPGRALKTACHVRGQFRCRSHAENNTGPTTVYEAFAVALNIFQRHLRSYQGKQLGGIRPLHGFRRNTKSHRVKSLRVYEAATTSIRLVGRLWVRIIIILDQPVAGRNI